MPVIAIASEFAGDGEIIARQVAARLGLSFLDHSNILERLAQHGFSPPEFDQIPSRNDLAGQKSWQLRKIGKIISSEVLFLAQKNSMLLHSPYAPYLLAGISHIPRVKVRTPSRQRANYFAEQYGCEQAEALERIRAHDEREFMILEEIFAVDSPQHAEHFDLVADTGWLSVTEWVEQILDLVQDPDFEPSAASRAKLRARAADAATPSTSGGHVFDSGCSAPC